jgi:hypothetical protein
VDGEATQQLLQSKEAIKGTELRQGALNKLSNLNGVLPPEDRRQIYEEASDPRMAQLADQKIAVLTDYNALRQLKGITNASRGYSTAEKVVLAARELEKPEAKKDLELVNNAEAYKAYIKDNPEMDSKIKEKLNLDIAEAAAAKIRNEYAQNRFNKAVEADRLPTRPPATEAVRPEDIKVNPATGTAAATSGIDRSKGRDILSNQQKVAQANQAAGNEYWSTNTRDVAQQVLMDGGRDENGNVVQPFSIALLEKIARGDRPVEGASQGVGPYGAGLPLYGEKYVDTFVKENLSNWTPTKGDAVSWGRKTQPTAQDFLKLAAQQRLDKIRAGAVANGPLSPEKKKEAEQFPIK